MGKQPILLRITQVIAQSPGQAASIDELAYALGRNRNRMGSELKLLVDAGVLRRSRRPGTGRRGPRNWAYTINKSHAIVRKMTGMSKVQTQIAPAERLAAYRQALADAGAEGKTLDELATATGYARRRVAADLRALVGAGTVVAERRLPEARGSGPLAYRLPEPQPAQDEPEIMSTDEAQRRVDIAADRLGEASPQLSWLTAGISGAQLSQTLAGIVASIERRAAANLVEITGQQLIEEQK